MKLTIWKVVYLIILVYDIVKNIMDPEHPLTLEQLNIVDPQHILVDNKNRIINVRFTPTIPNCSMSTLIGLMLKVKLINTVSPRYKV
jgi:metal-sulfur cluster biosynthetic enzyme